MVDNSSVAIIDGRSLGRRACKVGNTIAKYHYDILLRCFKNGKESYKENSQ